MSQFFPEPKYLGGRVKVELDFSKYVTKSDVKNVSGIIHQNLLKRLI